MLKEWICSAKEGKSVFVSEVRNEFDTKRTGTELAFELTLFNGDTREFIHYLPHWNDEEEKMFLRDYLNALVHNMLSALGGRKMVIYYDLSDKNTAVLAECLGKDLMVGGKNRTGYGKIINELDRVCAFLNEGRFSLETKDIAEYNAHGRNEHSGRGEECSSGGNLAEKLRRVVSECGRGVRCGIDIGGTDIKAVLSVNGRIEALTEYDWNPARFTTAEETVSTVAGLAKDLLGDRFSAFDSVGISFPDVVVRDRILGGETPKTLGLRESAADYDKEFSKITALNEAFGRFCSAGGIHVINDGNMAAYCAAVEYASGGYDALIHNGVMAHSLGTSLGAGWLASDGRIPEMTLEAYDFIIDIGDYVHRKTDPEDLRSVRNENSRLQGADRYAGQAAAFRYACEFDRGMLEGYAHNVKGTLRIGTEDEDMRKPCLEHIMELAEAGRPEAEKVFRCIGNGFAEVSLEMRDILQPETDVRLVFGRFVKRRRCFDLIADGFNEKAEGIILKPADDSMAYSPLMKQLSSMEGVTVAQFAQSVGAVYYGAG